MRRTKYNLIFFLLFASAPMVSAAPNKVVVVPMGDGAFTPIVIPQPEPEPEPFVPIYLDEAIDKPIVWNKGWDTSIGHRTKMDIDVKISLIRLEPVFGYPGIIFTPNQIEDWGEQTYFNSAKKIYAKAVLLVDKGETVEGGAFEWSLNDQGFISFHNIVRTDSSAAWIRGWTDPRRGDKVWFFIISNDEKFSSNPISFIWP